RIDENRLGAGPANRAVGHRPRRAGPSPIAPSARDPMKGHAGLFRGICYRAPSGLHRPCRIGVLPRVRPFPRTFGRGRSMPNFQRRDFLAGAAAFAAATTATLTGTRRAEAGDPSFMNNVPDPLLAGKELPTFKFLLEKSKGRVSGKSYAKEATVHQLPISKGIAGVTMGMAPGAMRELHWHATAAEWAFVDKG